MNHINDTARAAELYERACNNLMRQAQHRLAIDGLQREMEQIRESFGDLFEDRDGKQTLVFEGGALTMYQRSVATVDQALVPGLRRSLGAEMFGELFYVAWVDGKRITIPRERCIQRMSSADDPVAEDMRAVISVERHRQFEMHSPGCQCCRVNQVPQSKES